MPSVSTLSAPDTTTLDPAAPFRLSPTVGLRPEPFGALAYHFDTRRLVFLKAPELVDVVNALADHPSIRSTIVSVLGDDAATEHVQARYVRALTSLAESGVIEARTSTPERRHS